MKALILPQLAYKLRAALDRTFAQYFAHKQFCVRRQCAVVAGDQKIGLAARLQLQGQYARHAKARAKLRRINRQRSEEHTSELQSLMRNSYAVFCLKKKTTQ